METGRSLPNIEEVRVWATVTKATPDELTELARLIEQLATQAVSWQTIHRLGVQNKQQVIADLEARVTSIRVFQPVVVPGLLQIAEYARRVMALGYMGEAISDAVVMARMERQRILYDLTKHFEFIITEAALRFPVGPVEVMTAQLDRLSSVATLPNVTLGIIPHASPAPVPYMHAFQCFGDELVTAETYTAELQVQDARDLARYHQVFGVLREAALTGKPALALLRDVAAGQQ